MHPTLAKILPAIQQLEADEVTAEIVRIDMNVEDIAEVRSSLDASISTSEHITLPDGAAFMFLGYPVFPDVNRPRGGSVITRLSHG